jgi:hypothetical protein
LVRRVQALRFVGHHGPLSSRCGISSFVGPDLYGSPEVAWSGEVELVTVDCGGWKGFGR